jgi:ankyrin repeat protein
VQGNGEQRGVASIESQHANRADQRAGIARAHIAGVAAIHTCILNDRLDGGGEWRTTLSQARKNGHIDVVKYLESLGARD